MSQPTTHAAIAAMYDFTGRTVVLTGGTGVLGSEMARALAGCGANVVLLGRNGARAEAVIGSFGETAGRHLAIAGDVLDRDSIDAAGRVVIERYGRIDGLINGAGGNDPRATTSADRSFFDLPAEAFDHVVRLNLTGTVIPIQVFGRYMAAHRAGAILNVSSVSARRPLTRVGAYGAAKAAVTNLTQWLAVHLAEEYAPDLRVNAIMPGFFLTDQNRFLLTDGATGALTARGTQILAHTPMRRFGAAADLTGAMLWLLSPASQFVTGIVVPVDGGFTASAGV
jgi:NAD(P)-dependent dehydrogenase (short-subunit alcohol dehydrogenase family)